MNTCKGWARHSCASKHPELGPAGSWRPNLYLAGLGHLRALWLHWAGHWQQRLGEGGLRRKRLALVQAARRLLINQSQCWHLKGRSQSSHINWCSGVFATTGSYEFHLSCCEGLSWSLHWCRVWWGFCGAAWITQVRCRERSREENREAVRDGHPAQRSPPQLPGRQLARMEGDLLQLSLPGGCRGAGWLQEPTRTVTSERWRHRQALGTELREEDQSPESEDAPSCPAWLCQGHPAALLGVPLSPGGRWVLAQVGHHLNCCWNLKFLPRPGHQQLSPPSTGPAGAEVIQTPRHLIQGSGEKAMLTCQPVSGHSSVRWYQQTLGQGPKFLIEYYEQVPRDKGDMPERFSAQQFSNYSSQLDLSLLEPGDSALYLCASS